MRKRDSMITILDLMKYELGERWLCSEVCAEIIWHDRRRRTIKGQFNLVENFYATNEVEGKINIAFIFLKYIFQNGRCSI